MKLPHGFVRTDRPMTGNRTIRYYDITAKERVAVDKREDDGPAKIGELRRDSLTNEWVAVAAHRQTRVFLPPKELCPLCPTRPGLESEIADTDYDVVVFDNKSPSLATPDEGWELPTDISLDHSTTQSAGKCEVICFSPHHEGSFGELRLGQIQLVMEAWRDRVRDLSQVKHIAHIAPFENRGEEVGVTLNHPHGQIYAYSYLPPRVEKMLMVAKRYKESTGRVLHDDIIARELQDKVRIVCENEHWLAYVPFAARYPYEIHVSPKVRTADLSTLSQEAANAFPSIAKEVLTRLDGVFNIKMAYIAAWHQAPVREGRDLLGLHWQITSIRRAPGKLKYLAGSESAMGAFIMDLTPESSAEQLRAVVIK
jgi:UDPglucose--hexose-1-phosphate uridylyltransferase